MNEFATVGLTFFFVGEGGYPQILYLYHMYSNKRCPRISATLE